MGTQASIQSRSCEGGRLQRCRALPHRAADAHAECDPANYLDRSPGPAFSDEDNARFVDRNDAAGRAGNRDGFILGPVAAHDGTIWVNDRLGVVSYDDLMPRVMRRVAEEVATCLRGYATRPENRGRMPWAAPLCRSRAADPSWRWSEGSGVRFGRVPDTPFLATGRDSGTTMLPNWQSGCRIADAGGETAGMHSHSWWNAWKRHVFYSVAPAGSPATATSTACDSLTCLFIADDAGGPAPRGHRFAVLVAGPPLLFDSGRQSRGPIADGDAREWLEQCDLRRLNANPAVPDCDAEPSIPAGPGLAVVGPRGHARDADAKRRGGRRREARFVKPAARAFTLLEVMLVMLIFAILLAGEASARHPMRRARPEETRRILDNAARLRGHAGPPPPPRKPGEESLRHGWRQRTRRQLLEFPRRLPAGRIARALAAGSGGLREGRLGHAGQPRPLRCLGGGRTIGGVADPLTRGRDAPGDAPPTGRPRPAPRDLRPGQRLKPHGGPAAANQLHAPRAFLLLSTGPNASATPHRERTIGETSTATGSSCLVIHHLTAQGNKFDDMLAWVPLNVLVGRLVSPTASLNRAASTGSQPEDAAGAFRQARPCPADCAAEPAHLVEADAEPSLPALAIRSAKDVRARATGTGSPESSKASSARKCRPSCAPRPRPCRAHCRCSSR